MLPLMMLQIGTVESQTQRIRIATIASQTRFGDTRNRFQLRFRVELTDRAVDGSNTTHFVLNAAIGLSTLHPNTDDRLASGGRRLIVEQLGTDEAWTRRVQIAAVAVDTLLRLAHDVGRIALVVRQLLTPEFTARVIQLTTIITRTLRFRADNGSSIRSCDRTIVDGGSDVIGSGTLECTALRVRIATIAVTALGRQTNYVLSLILTMLQIGALIW
jgi:hypothetical protein